MVDFRFSQAETILQGLRLLEWWYTLYQNMPYFATRGTYILRGQIVFSSLVLKTLQLLTSIHVESGDIKGRVSTDIGNMELWARG